MRSLRTRPRPPNAARLTKEEGVIDWALPRPPFTIASADCILAARVHVGERAASDRLKSRVETVTTTLHQARWLTARSGTGLRVATGHGASTGALELQAEGSRAMLVRDFLAGHPVQSGTGLGSDPGLTAHMTAPARTAAFHALVAIAADHVDLPAALPHPVASVEDERDRALAASIVTGALRWQRARSSRRAFRHTSARQSRPR